MEFMMLPRAQLRFGHEHPDGDYNVRKIGRDADRPDLRQSIRSKGILQSLLATTRDGDKTKDGKFVVYVIGGNSRLRQADIIADETPAESLSEFPVLVHQNLALADAMELAEATERNQLPPHIVDRYEAYAPMIEAGHTVEQVCEVTGASPLDVKRAMALGGLHSSIRNAWREGELDKDDAEAFTLAPDLKTQKKVFEALKKAHCLQAHHIRKRLLPDQGDASRLVEFVGFDAYRARGGSVIVDLFHNNHGVSDPALAKAMAAERLEVECKRLVEIDGWKWARPEDAMSRDWNSWHHRHHQAQPTKDEDFQLKILRAKFERDDFNRTDEEEREADAAEYTYDRLIRELEYREYTPDERSSSGCVVSIDEKGRLQLEPGMVEPKAKAAGKVHQGDAPSELQDEPKPAKAKPKEEAEPVLPRSAVERVNVELTEAAARTLADNPDLAIVFLLAGFAGQEQFSMGGGPIRVRHDGLGSNDLKLLAAEEIAINISRLIAMKAPARMKLVAQAVAASLDLSGGMTDEDVSAIVNALDPKLLRANLDKTWDDEAFFAAAPKKMIVAAIDEACGEMAARDCAELKKDELVKRAIANVTPSSWLPPELRSAHYTGPGAKKKAGKAKPK